MAKSLFQRASLRMAETWSRARRGKIKKNDPYTKFDALAARRALRDAYRAKNEFSAALSSKNLATIRLRWITAITILRAVGHTLVNIDASRSSALHSAIDSAWNRWKSDSFQNLIFHEFIEKERNTILKEYRTSLFASPSQQSKFSNNAEHYSTVLVGDRAYYPLEALNVSLEWWETELDRIEAQAGNPNT